MRISRFFVFAPVAAAFAFFGIALGIARAQSDAIVVERDVPAKMRDGVILKADIYRRKAAGKYPVLLQRTPYDKSGARSIAIRAAQRGYIVVVQDVRGR